MMVVLVRICTRKANNSTARTDNRLVLSHLKLKLAPLIATTLSLRPRTLTAPSPMTALTLRHKNPLENAHTKNRTLQFSHRQSQVSQTMLVPKEAPIAVEMAKMIFVCLL